MQAALTLEPIDITVLPVRTTILLDDELGEKLREVAKSRGMSLSAFLAEAGRTAMAAEQANEPAEPFRLITRGGSGVHDGIDLNRPSALIAAEEEREFRP